VMAIIIAAAITLLIFFIVFSLFFVKLQFCVQARMS